MIEYKGKLTALTRNYGETIKLEIRNMSTINTIYDRHSVRQYHNQPLREEVIHVLRSEIDACNQESGLHIQLVTNEPKAFDSFMAHYGKI